MVSKTTYKCDVCDAKIKIPEMHLRVEVNGDMVCDNLDLCSWRCFKFYVNKKDR